MGTVSTNDIRLFEGWLASRSILQIRTITKLELNCGLVLAGQTLIRWDLPVPRDGMSLRNFSGLKIVKIFVAVTGQRHNNVRPDEGKAQKQIIDLGISFKRSVPHVTITTAYVPCEGLERLWRPAVRPII